MKATLHDLELLLRGSHPMIMVDGDEEDRAAALLTHVVERLGLVSFRWSAAYGLTRRGEPQPVYATSKLDACLDHIGSSGMSSAVYHLEGASHLFGEPERAAKLLALCEPLSRIRSTIVLTGTASALPEHVNKRITRVTLEPPSDAEYYQLVNSILADVRRRMPVSMELDAVQSSQLIAHLRGLPLFEVRRVVTQAILRDKKLGEDDLPYVLNAKRDVVEKSGVLEYYEAEQTLEQIAGLGALKQWLTMRTAAFREPERALQFGLTPPRGLLLLGVQGCGKSMCAKAVASAWGLPLLRLDPARLYDKYLGESEKNLRKAVELAERLAPVVLWIDELEKVFSQNKGEDSGATQRILGSFLTWLQEKKDGVFVIATSNDVSRLAPELLRKGRFDEIFFVDLPDEQVRADILRVHLTRRKRDPLTFDIAELARATDGFSGAELEQAVVAALYSAFAQQTDLTSRHLSDEIARTTPLSVTMAEPIDELRAWAQTRTVSAH